MSLNTLVCFVIIRVQGALVKINRYVSFSGEDHLRITRNKEVILKIGDGTFKGFVGVGVSHADPNHWKQKVENPDGSAFFHVDANRVVASYDSIINGIPLKMTVLKLNGVSEEIPIKFISCSSCKFIGGKAFHSYY